MLRPAFALLCAAAALGGGLALVYLQGRRPGAWVALAHGALGAAGLVFLLLALGRGLPPGAMGTAGFAPMAAGLLALALALGIAMEAAAWRQRRPAGALVATHAGLAVAGLVMLLAVVALG
ncbi:MAG TPA: hypothetical protein VKQ70_15805 [Caulobacteraceae bacterium]|nr:hypothetical protein [Caulobacteraceae bacterium]